MLQPVIKFSLIYHVWVELLHIIALCTGICDHWPY